MTKKLTIIFLSLLIILTFAAGCSKQSELAAEIRDIISLEDERAALSEASEVSAAGLTEEIMEKLASIEEEYFALGQRQLSFLIDEIGGSSNVLLQELWTEYFASARPSPVP